MSTRRNRKKEEEFFKDPNVIIKKLGEYKLIVEKTLVPNFSATCIAMDNIAKAEYRDDTQRKEGINDYNLSLEKLLSAFDTFIREYSKNKFTAGFQRNFDFKNSCELTIYLLWQIRHTLVHHGGVIDKKCKQKYEEEMKNAFKNNVKPIINLPQKIKVGYEFIINFKNYRTVKKCIFKHFEKRIPKQNVSILHKRSCIANIDFTGIDVIIDIGKFYLAVDITKASNKIFEMDKKTGAFIFKSESIYNPKKKRLTFPSTGESIKAELIEKDKIDLKKKIVLKMKKK